MKEPQSEETVLPEPTWHAPGTPFFSGDYSRAMWRRINAIKDPEALEALYFVGCRLQEFESYVRRKFGEFT